MTTPQGIIEYIQPRRSIYNEGKHLIYRLQLRLNKCTKMAVVLFANSPHNLVRRPIYSHVVLIHRIIPTAWRTRHQLSKIHPWPMTMDQAQSSSGSSTNLVIHHSTQLGRLRKYAAKPLKG